MEPQIQYAKTSDGVSIAYAVFGDGPPVFFTGVGFGDIHLYSSGLLPMTRITDALVALGRRVILYDGRGTGSSERGEMDFSLDGRLRDLEAVTDRTGVHRFALWCVGMGGPTGIAFAAKQPERVLRLVLAATYANGADLYRVIPMLRASRAVDTMAEEQWEYNTLALANAVTGFTDSDLANRLAATLRSGMSARTYLSIREASEKIDVANLLPLVRAPTLVVHLVGNAFSNIDLLRVLASRIPNARLVATEDPLASMAAFLREDEEQAAVPPELPSGMTAILFIDIADSTALTERMGDVAFRAKARELGGTLRGLIREYGGAPVEGPTLGDGVLAVFTSAREAIEAAVRCRDEGGHAGLPLHVGLHAGDVTSEKDPDRRANVYGGAVNIAARVAAASAAGETLVSGTVRDLARTSAGVTFEDRGEQSLKGIEEPVRLFAVTLRER